MNIIIYGPDPPKISFTQKPDGSIAFQVENERVVKFRNGQETIRWLDLLDVNTRYRYSQLSKKERDRRFQDFATSEIIPITGSEAERKFLLDYLNEYAELNQGIDTTSLWEYPALIPQVWVNWIHYDPKDSRRAKRAQKEPFRVDFMLKDKDISPGFVILEIDGLSHFGSIETYTQHLRKDRWLRRQGWGVIRLSNSEVEEYEQSFLDFFAELTGKAIDIPF